DNNKILFTAGQFAKLHNINKRTLLYYDEIGLLSPELKGENGYRYYTYHQSQILEMLLTLRELDMSIKDIMKYMEKVAPLNLKEDFDNVGLMVGDKKQLIKK
ncbi:MAG: Nif3-like dinuclear metal center hexameric protein, partial [Clostridiales bacterium]